MYIISTPIMSFTSKYLMKPLICVNKYLKSTNTLMSINE